MGVLWPAAALLLASGLSSLASSVCVCAHVSLPIAGFRPPAPSVTSSDLEASPKTLFPNEATFTGSAVQPRTVTQGQGETDMRPDGHRALSLDAGDGEKGLPGSGVGEGMAG